MAERKREVGRQIKLPLSRAAEIAWKQIRMRFARSLVVTSGIILALAFLMSIRATQAITDSMRDWAQSADKTGAYVELKAQREQVRVTRQGPKAAEMAGYFAGYVRAGGKLPKDAKTFAEYAGEEYAVMARRLAGGGAMPGTAEQLRLVMAAKKDGPDLFKEWVKATEEVVALTEKINEPGKLAADMKANGVPTTAAEIASDRIQTRWLLGLALLVAFVGILNAMLMSVTERFREIGTMKCLGALDGFIVKLFLLESLYQGIVGTVLGILLGLLLAVASATGSYGARAFVDFPVGSILAGAGLCFLVGVTITVAGAVYPAWQAARMHPIEAMRSET